MQAKRSTEDWVESIRTFLRDELGANWQIVKNKGKVMLGIRFDDGSRTYKYLPYRWERAKQGKIRQFIEKQQTSNNQQPVEHENIPYFLSTICKRSQSFFRVFFAGAILG